jgi:cytochrome P450
VHGEDIALILRHADVRRAAKDWQTFSSDAPYRVPIPSEEADRSMRQLPIETDPPLHTEYRELVEPIFRRPKDPAVIARIEDLIGRLITHALAQPSIEAVHEFALPLQSRALAHLLNVTEAEAEIWIGWGTHVFRDGGGPSQGSALETYLHGAFDRALAQPGDDFFSVLTRATFRGRPLTREEMMGFGNLAFAGGRDTIIYTVASILAYLGENPAALEYLRADPARITHASEEFFRVYMPLTHIGRVCPVATNVHGVTVPAGQRVALGWASANRDETVFASPDEVQLDRKPNPHLSFCLGAAHARLLVRTLLDQAIARLSRLEILEARPRFERTESYSRQVGFESLRLRFVAR